MAYHNAIKMGFPSTAIYEPQIRTKKGICGLEGVTVWLIAGEGKSPKQFLLAARFLAIKCESGKYPGTELPNRISGIGALFGRTIVLSRTSLLDSLKKISFNFRSGFSEIQDGLIISELETLA